MARARRCRLACNDPTRRGIPSMNPKYATVSALVLAALFLNRPAIADQPALPPLQIAQGTSELDFWNAIKDSKKADDYKSYLDKYPNGEFVDLAKLRVQQYGAPAEPAAAEPKPAEPAI